MVALPTNKLVHGRRTRKGDDVMTVTTSGTRIIGGVLAHLAAGAVAILFACAAAAQSAPQLGVAPAAEPQPRAKPPGLFGTIGRWVDDSIAGMSSGWRNARTAVGDLGDQATGAAKDAAGAARDAAATVMRLPATSIVSGRGL